MAMAMSVFLNFLFPPPPSLFVTTMSVITAVSLAKAGFSEVKGEHLNYSKFWNVNNAIAKKQMKNISSRNGMLLLYTPAFLAGAASFWVFPNESFRSMILQGAVTVHFFKRVFEVM
jgi:very-long-chain enoyl-CoA reductase